MSKRRSPEDTIVAWFTDAPLGQIDIMQNIIKGIVKRRTAPAPTVAPAKRTVVRRRKSAPSQPATSFPPAEQAVV